MREWDGACFHVVLGAFLHDIGKFFERGGLLADYRSDENMQQMLCRWNHEKGCWGYKHVLHTLRFCEELTNHISILKPEEGRTDKAAASHWINMAARHHVAEGEAFEFLVRHADHLASAEREQDKCYENDIHQRTLLEPMMERANLRGESRPVVHRLPIAEVTLAGEDNMPEKVETLGLEESNGAWLSPDRLSDDYARLGRALLEDLERLPSPARLTADSARGIIASLLALFARYLSQVPAATNVQHPDISLFDHLRVTAAIAEGLYRHHAARGELDDIRAIAREDRDKWRLVCGDFSGIQSFIYRIASSGAAKALRGRSLYIQLLCDAASEYLMRRLGLMPTARIYSSGGKFYLLIADAQEDALRQAASEVNAWLLNEFGGDVFLGIGVAKVGAKDFKGGKMSAKWREAHDSLMEDRNRRFAAQMDADFFAPQASLDKGAHCEVCGRSDADADLRDNRCVQCRSLEKLGQHIADATHLFWRWGGDAPRFAHEPLASVPFDGLGCTLYLLNESPAFASELGALNESVLERINDPDCMDGNALGYACRWRWLGKWDRNKESGRWEFDDFSGNATGIKRLGVLRMDVDNLGQLFIRGFRWASNQTMGSLSRVATLSRQLDYFFSGHLMHLLREDARVQVIYAGGDDLFLIGSWDALPQVARKIQRAFSRYAAHNPDFTISGGMTMVGGKYPIAHAAELAGEEEERAKSLTRRVNGTMREKSAFCMLGTPVGWEDFEAVDALRGLIGQTFAVNRGVLGRLRDAVAAQWEFVRQKKEGGMDEQSVRKLLFWQRWRWLLVYHLHRVARRHGEIEAQVAAIRRAVLGNEIEGRNSETHVIDWLQLPVRWAEFLHREAN